MATVLIIDDSEIVRGHVKSALSDLFERFLEAGDGIEGFKQLLNNEVDMVVSDFLMPGIDGFKFLSLKNQRDELVEIPVIMLTGEGDVKSKVRCLEAGAADYLMKPFHDEELVARVRVHLKLKALQDELREKNQRLEELSRMDGLTKLNNRRHFMEVLELEFIRAVRYDTPLSYAMIDLDHFKQINDSHGHLIGDEVLKRAARVLESNLRKHDVAGRYGGEEFGIILPQTTLEGARVVMERCRQEIAELEIPTPDEILTVTASFGVSHGPSAQVDDITALIRAADEALYRAKENGRNRVET